ncbi:MAG: bifunctional lysine ketoglutarate reductase /saccharopine dehydrogenase family protein [Thermoplasmata archaeon]
MNHCIGIRREDKNRWERRVPLTPEQVKKLKEEHSVEVVVQPSKIRAFSDDDYTNFGVRVDENLSSCQSVFAIKEIPIALFEPKKTYVFFAHVIKGQEHNMPLLKKMMELGCNLIDYERIVNEKGFRLIFFGKWAGLAGMTDTLSALGKSLEYKGIVNPFTYIKYTHNYKDHLELKEAISKVGEIIKNEGLPRVIVPMVVGLAGYGNVSKGCQEILDHLPNEEIPPEQLISFNEKKDFSDRVIYKVVFKEEHMVEPRSPDHKFGLQDYYDHPEKYRGVFPTYVPYLSILMNCIYWDKMYPRLVTKELVRKMFTGEKEPKLKVIGDISCDIEGAVEFTMKATGQDSPTFVYDPREDKITDGHEGQGIVVMAVDNLPCELPRESSTQFGDSLFEFVPSIAKADFSLNFDELKLPLPVKKAVILHHGKLTPDYKYLEKFL